MNFKRFQKLAFLFLICIILSALQWDDLLFPQDFPLEPEANVVGFSNPAAVYCKELGYDYQLQGNEGYCIFPDETTCPEWDFMNGQCGVEYSSCAQHGLTL